VRTTDFSKAIISGFLGIMMSSAPVGDASAAGDVGWKKMPGKASEIAIGGGWVWILTTTKARGGFTVQRWNVATKKWDTISGASGNGIDVDPDGNAWVRSHNSAAGGKFDGKKFGPGGGSGGRDFAVGDGVNFWGIETHVNPDGNSRLMSYRRFRRQYVLEEATGIRLDVGVNGQVWYVKRDGSIDRYTGQLPKNNRLTQASDWSTVSGKAIDVSIGDDGTVWAVGKTKKPMKWTGNAWQNLSSPSGLKGIAVDRTGLPWAVADNGDIYAASNSAALLPPPNPSLAILKRTKACKKCDLSSADLRNADLRNVRLDGANLSGAKLSSADLTGANLTGADFQRAILTNTNLTQAILTGASFVTANLQYADLRGANLTGLDFTRADMEYAKLDRATLTKATFLATKLINAYLKRVTALETNFSRANFANAKLQNADIKKANFTQADFWQARLSNADATGTNFSRAIFNDTWFDNVVAKDAIFKKAKFKKTRLLGTNFDGATGDQGKCLVGKSTGQCICQIKSGYASSEQKCHPRN